MTGYNSTTEVYRTVRALINGHVFIARLSCVYSSKYQAEHIHTQPAESQTKAVQGTITD